MVSTANDVSVHNVYLGDGDDASSVKLCSDMSRITDIFSQLDVPSRMEVESFVKTTWRQIRRGEVDWSQVLLIAICMAVAIEVHFRMIVKAWRHVRAKGAIGTVVGIYKAIEAIFVRWMLSLPPFRRQLSSEMDKLRAQLREKIDPASYPKGVVLRSGRTLPEQGRSREWLEEEWRNLKGIEGGDAGEGRVSGTVYHGGEDLSRVTSDAMSNFLLSNPLHSSVFPATRKMESEIVGMCLDLFHGSPGAGTTTSGGTESIIMAVKTYRDWARKTKGIKHPEMVVPSSAHAAFWKAAQYFKIKIHSIPVDQKTRKANVKWMARAINRNTIMIAGSAPNFPDGIVDPIPALAALAKRKGIGMHVDCCLGSFIMPFLNRNGLGDKVDKFDFQVDGVTSISCDIHKYGFCPKGISVIMYRSSELRRYQYYVITDWPGGVYASPTMAGSRPGMILAGAWAVLQYIGADGYSQSCRKIVIAARTFAAQIKARFPTDLYILGDPQVSVVAFGSHTLNIYAVGDLMSKKGWHLNGLASPPALHMAFTLPTSETVDKLLDDLEEVITQIKKEPQGQDKGDMVAMYGIGQTRVGPLVVEELAKTYIDVLYE